MISLLLLLGMGATAFAPAASAAPVYSPPSGAWARFTSDLDAAQGLATGSGVTIALVSTGVDSAFIGGGKVTTGPNYIFKPQAAESQMIGTQFAAFLVGAHGQSAGIAPGARILSLRTEPDSTEPGARTFFTNGSDVDEQATEAKAIRYAASHGAQVILTDFGSTSEPSADLISSVGYAVSRNVVIVTGAFPVSGASSRYLYPEGLPGVIGVAPVTLPGGTPPQATLGAQHNNSVLISAPANEVPASLDFTLLNFGTAMGLVTGTVALIKQRYPHISPALVARALAMSARYHPSGGYSTSAGFGVLDPYDAILDAGKVTSLAGTAPAGGFRAVTAGGHFGKPPGVTSALPPIGRAAYLYWALIAVGAVLLVSDLALVVRRRRRRSRVRRGGSTQFVPQAPVPQYAAPAQVAQPYGAQQYAGQPYAGQESAGQQDPGQQDSWQQHVGSRYLEATQPAAQYPADQYPAVPNPAPPYQARPSFSPRPVPPPTRPQPVLPETPPGKPAESGRGWFDPQ
jgi:hypothetical protein